MEVFVFQVCIALCVQILINWVGKHSYQFGYLNLSDLSRGFLGFNIIYRALAAPICIIIVTLFLSSFESLSHLVVDIWFVAIYFGIINFLYALLLGRLTMLPLTSVGLYFIAHALSIGISLLIYSTYIQSGISTLLPTADNFRSELWILVILFLYRVSNELPLGASDENAKKRMRTKLNRLYLKFHKKFFRVLDKRVQASVELSTLFFSIAIYEHLNRGYFMRTIERLFFRFLKNKTTGLMQVHANRPLSDIESIKLAEKILLKRYQAMRDLLKNEIDIFRKPSGINFLLRGYNTGLYAENVREIFESLCIHLPLPEEPDEKLALLMIRADLLNANYEKLKAFNCKIQAAKLQPDDDKIFQEVIIFAKQEQYLAIEERIDRLLVFKNWISDSSMVTAPRKKKMKDEIEIAIAEIEIMPIIDLVDREKLSRLARKQRQKK